MDRGAADGNDGDRCCDTAGDCARLERCDGSSGGLAQRRVRASGHHQVSSEPSGERAVVRKVHV